MAKGAGMIAPKMAPMLAYVLSDAAVEANLLRCILCSVADPTFDAGRKTLQLSKRPLMPS
jgi:glutamate N-acetyltransferase / amino-acid N-acetyltransferase